MIRRKKEPTGRNARISPKNASTNGQVFSYHANRAYREKDFARDSSIPQIEAKRSRSYSLKKRLEHVLMFAVGIVILLAILNLSGKSKVVVVGGNNQVFLRDHKVYDQAASALFSNIFNQNKLTVNSRGIERAMQAQFPELQTVVVSLSAFGSSPKVYVSPSVPKLIYVSKSSMFVLDGNGRALIAANQVARLEKLNLPAVTDQNGQDITLGKVAIPKSYVTFIAEVSGQLKAKGLKITSVTLPLVANEMDVRIEGVNYSVKFNLQGDAREEVGSFLALQKYMTANGKTAAQYIDVRVEGKAYYK